MTYEFSHTKNGEPQYDLRAESSWDAETFNNYVKYCEKIGYFDHWKHEDGSQMTPEEVYEEIMQSHIPAWSLNRLMSLMPRTVKVDGRVYGCMMELGGCVQYINLIVGKIIWAAHYSVSNSFDGLISCIEWLIKEGYFNKEYLI